MDWDRSNFGKRGISGPSPPPLLAKVPHYSCCSSCLSLLKRSNGVQWLEYWAMNGETWCSRKCQETPGIFSALCWSFQVKATSYFFISGPKHVISPRTACNGIGVQHDLWLAVMRLEWWIIKFQNQYVGYLRLFLPRCFWMSSATWSKPMVLDWVLSMWSKNLSKALHYYVRLIWQKIIFEEANYFGNVIWCSNRLSYNQTPPPPPPRVLPLTVLSLPTFGMIHVQGIYNCRT